MRPAPLSYAQERMWFHSQLEPASTLYMGVRATRWRGPLHCVALERAVGELVRRHEVLRTRFPLRDSGPIQDVQPAGEFHLPLVDLSGSSSESALVASHAWLLAESRRRFDLTAEAPFRAALLRLAEDDHVLALTIHHVAFDRWSRSILCRELGTLYTAFAVGGACPLADPPMQFLEYARWQREWASGEDFDRQLEYWRARLQGAPAVVDLPLDRPRQAAGDDRGRQAGFLLAGGLLQALDRLARRERVSRFMTLLASFDAFLARVTDQTDLVVGAPIAGRTRLELNNLIGCFTNTLVLRTDLSGDPPFRELLGRVRQASLAAFAHQEMPFEALVRELHPERRLGQHPLFQVLFNYLDFPPEPLTVPGIEIEDLEVASPTALVDLGVEIRRAGDALSCTFTCPAGLFDAGTTTHLANQYLSVLEAVAAEPDLRVSVLPVTRRQPDARRTDSLLRELEQMTDEEADRQLAAECGADTDE